MRRGGDGDNADGSDGDDDFELTATKHGRNASKETVLKWIGAGRWSAKSAPAHLVVSTKDMPYGNAMHL